MEYTNQEKLPGLTNLMKYPFVCPLFQADMAKSQPFLKILKC